jgi:hypothetical protein
MSMLLCALYALLNLVIFCVVVLVVWLVIRWVLVTFAPAVVIDPRIWQGIGLIIFLIIAIVVVQMLVAGGMCGVGKPLWH